MTVGAELKRARLRLEYSVPDVASKTRIRADLITAIEADDFAACGGDVFARGHVRAIATALDLDPTPLLESMGANTAATALEALEPESLSIWQLKERAYKPSERRVWALIIIVGLVIVAALLWRANASAEPMLDAADLPAVTSSATATVIPEPTPTESPTESVTPTSSATAEPSSAPTEVAATATPPQETDAAVLSGAIVLQLDSVQSSWVRITNAVGTIYEGTMRAGQTKVFTSDSDVTVRVGNAAGVMLTVNDVAYANLGQPGEVYRHTFRVA